MRISERKIPGGQFQAEDSQMIGGAGGIALILNAWLIIRFGFCRCSHGRSLAIMTRANRTSMTFSSALGLCRGARLAANMALFRPNLIDESERSSW
jgi:hypothetical protein